MRNSCAVLLLKPLTLILITWYDGGVTVLRLGFCEISHQHNLGSSHAYWGYFSALL